MAKYEEKESQFGWQFIARENENGSISVIPKDPANSDYQRYLRWLENPDADDTQGGIN